MSDRSDSEIIDAAIEVWNKRGFHDATHRELARKLGMGLGALYARFPSQEDLALRLYEMLSRQAVDSVDSAAATDAGSRLQHFMRHKLALLQPHRDVLASIFREAVDPDSRLSPLGPNASEAREVTCGMLADILECEADHPTVAATWLVHALVILYWLHDRSDDQQDTDELVEWMGALLELLPSIALLPRAEQGLELLTRVFRKQSATQPTVVAEPETSHSVDVVVVGAGPIGVLYASWLKLAQPDLAVVCLERLERPGHKIGESTLSGFCKACRSVGIPHHAMQALFYPKNGLGFFHIDESTREITEASEYILETFDETFQVERRPLDTLLIENARRLGVRIIQGATFDTKASTYSRDKSVAVYTVSGQTYRVASRLIVDASGPAGLLGHHLGLFDETGVAFQSGAVWGYFKNVKRLAQRQWPSHAQFPRDTYTQHLCFREGWLWYIPLYSWQDAPTSNLDLLTRSLLTGTSNDNLDTTCSDDDRRQLAREFGCPLSEITSIGLVLRADRDDDMPRDPLGAFQAYRRRYPVMDQLLEGAELLRSHYEEPYPMTSRRGFRRRARRVAGDGWLLIGDAAFFVDPLISPGLTGGAATAYAAVQATLTALKRTAAAGDAFAEYEQFVHRLHGALERDNQLVYLSFNHPTALRLIQQFQEIDARRHFHDHESDTYGGQDTNVWGILNDDYQVYQRQLLELMHAEERRVAETVPVTEQTTADYDVMVERMRELLDTHLGSNESLTPYITQNRTGAVTN